MGRIALPKDLDRIAGLYCNLIGHTLLPQDYFDHIGGRFGVAQALSDILRHSLAGDGAPKGRQAFGGRANATLGGSRAPERDDAGGLNTIKDCRIAGIRRVCEQPRSIV